MARFVTISGECAASGIYEFYKEIDVKQDCEVSIHAFAVMRYILYVNGQYVCEGPCKSAANIRYYDELDAVKLKKGKNEIKLVVMHLVQSRRFSTVFKAPKPIVLFEAVGEGVEVVTDATWQCRFVKGYKLHHDSAYALQLPPQEEVFAQEETVALETEILEHSDDFNFAKGLKTDWGIVSGYNLTKRPIPMIQPGREISFKVVKSGDGFVELDAGTYVTAIVEAEIAEDADVKIVYAECYEQEYGKKLRDDSTGYLSGYSDKIHTGSEGYHFRSFWFRAFRFIRVEAKDVTRMLRSLKAYLCTYPFDICGTFTCSDESYNQMHEVSINTMLACTHEIFVDCPYYEQQQYAMDAAIEASVMMRMTEDTRMVRKCITEFAASQQPDGLLAAHYPADYLQVIPGFSFFWIHMLKDYLDYTKDIDFARQYIGTIDKILGYFDEQMHKYGYITKTPYWWDYVDWVPGWHCGMPNVDSKEAYTVYNLYYACGLLAAKNICIVVGMQERAEEYERRYEDVKKVLYAYCYDRERGLFKDGSATNSFSEHAIIWAVLSEVVSGEEAKEMMSHIFDEDISKCSFSANYYVFRALEKSDRYEDAFQILEQWKTMLDWHCTTWCEEPHNPRSECHAWSCAPLYEFSANILGVKCSIKDEILIAPKPGHLSFAKGIVPTRFGQVSVDWKMEKETFEIEVRGPENVLKRVVLPEGLEISSYEKKSKDDIVICCSKKL